uniref:ShKT domain-containing protein n=1 Tax=Dunaliella tertiolecta TaxID=3047 RepID=A0A7S3VM30_DUNTE
MRGTLRVHQLLSIMLLFCGNAQSASRTGAFIGYSEELSGVPATGSPAGTACRDKDPSCADWASRGECTANPGYMLAACPISCKQCTPPELNLEMYANKTLVLKTDLGEVYITMLWDNAPRAAALIMDLAHQGTSQQERCRFYRNEAAPLEGGGPPYGKTLFVTRIHSFLADVIALGHWD